MIRLENIVKTYSTHSGVRTILNHLNFTIQRGEKIGILGRNGAGKSTLIRLLSGAELPDSGLITREMSVSWPLAFGGAFQGSLTGMDNIRFVSRIYGADLNRVVEYVKEFSELGIYLDEPVKKYSSGMRARLAFGISLAIEFDCFLVDEVVAVGDAHFQEKSRIELFEKRKDRAMILVSHHPDQIMAYCNKAAVLRNGKMHMFEDTQSAYDFYQTE